MSLGEIIQNVESLAHGAVSWLPQIAMSLGVLIVGWYVISCFSHRLKQRLEKTRAPRHSTHRNGGDSDDEEDEDEDGSEDNVALGGMSMHLKGPPIDPTLIHFAMSAFEYVLKFLLVLVCASMVGIQTTSFIAILTAMSLAIGLSVQGLFTDVAKGVMLILFRPFKVGDKVNVADHMAIVKEVGIFTTILQGKDNVLHFIPNHLIDTITNVSAMGTMRMDVAFTISNDEDWPKVKKLLVDVAHQEGMVLKQPPPKTLVTKISENGTEATLRVWVKSEHDDDYPLAILERVKMAFSTHQIKCPRNLFSDPMPGQKREI